MSEVRIVMTDHGRGEVFVDGQKIENIEVIRFDADAKRIVNELTLRILPRTIEIEGPADVDIQDSRLVRLLESIADDPGTMLEPDLAFEVQKFRTRWPEKPLQLPRPSEPCKECLGNRVLYDNGTAYTCPHCRGTGVRKGPPSDLMPP